MYKTKNIGLSSLGCVQWPDGNGVLPNTRSVTSLGFIPFNRVVKTVAPEGYSLFSLYLLIRVPANFSLSPD